MKTTTIRRKFSAVFKAQVALEAIKERETLSELALKYKLHLNQISQWKIEFIKNSSKVFENKTLNNQVSNQDETDVLYKKIGQLEIEKDYLKKNLQKLGIV